MTRVNFASIFWMGTLLIVTTGCSAEPVTATGVVTNTPVPSVTATVPCAQELIAPQIMEIQPAQAVPGSELTVTGSGGYVRDSCGGYIEGAREFKLYLDNEPVSDLSCYVNHCEAKLILPSTLSTGKHCLSVEMDKCQFEFQITE